MIIRLVHCQSGTLGDINLHSMPVKGDLIATRVHGEVEIISVTHVEDGHLGCWAQLVVQDA